MLSALIGRLHLTSWCSDPTATAPPLSLVSHHIVSTVGEGTDGIQIFQLTSCQAVQVKFVAY